MYVQFSHKYLGTTVSRKVFLGVITALLECIPVRPVSCAVGCCFKYMHRDLF